MIKIIGAGMAGLLCARMLHRHDPVIYERADKLPNNHTAVLRFRSPEVGDVLGIPFKKVRVLKGTADWRGPVSSVLAYTDKTLGEYRTDRSIPIKFEVVDRWIAPPDLIARMAEGINVVYDHDHDFLSIESKVISTIPMPDLAAQLGYEPFRAREFGHIAGVNLRATVDRCEAYLSLYVPDPAVRFSRLSITGSELIIEYQNAGWTMDTLGYKVDIIKACAMLGIDPDRVISHEVYPQKYAKIIPVPETERREFIYWASTLQGRAYSLGRFATWRPGLLVDDLPRDIRFIESMMAGTVDRYMAERDHVERSEQ